jgi:hypothetical protein
VPPTDIWIAICAAIAGYLIIGAALQIGHDTFFEGRDILTAPLGVLLDYCFRLDLAYQNTPGKQDSWWRHRRVQLFLCRKLLRDTAGGMLWRRTLHRIATEFVPIAAAVVFFTCLTLWVVVIPISLAILTHVVGGPIFVGGLPLYGHLGQHPNDCSYVNFLGWEDTDCYVGYKPASLR